MLARPGLPEFEYIKAGSPQEVFALLSEYGKDIKLLMGGTDLFIQMRDRSGGPGTLLDLKGLPGIQEISFDPNAGLGIGAGATLNAIQNHEGLQEHFPALSQAAGTVGNYQLRNRATMGGNVCNASPSADLAPAALIYEGTALLDSPRGERELSLDQFWLGPGRTALAGDEYLKGFHFPLPPAGSKAKYIKLGRSKLGDLAIVGVAVLGFPAPELPAGIRFRIGLNSTAPTPYRVPEVEEFLASQPLTEDILSRAAEMAMDFSAPIEDVRATALYQKKMVRNLTFKALKEIQSSLVGSKAS